MGETINEPAHKVQIAHEAIASLNWPAMSMWFTLGTRQQTINQVTT